MGQSSVFYGREAQEVKTKQSARDGATRPTQIHQAKMRPASNSSTAPRPIILATRGSALAMVQTNLVLAHCRAAFPEMQFEARIIKTTGDKLQTAPPDLPGMPGTKGLFTKELEVALLNGEADLAVHSLKDLPKIGRASCREE